MQFVAHSMYRTSNDCNAAMRTTKGHFVTYFGELIRSSNCVRALEFQRSGRRCHAGNLCSSTGAGPRKRRDQATRNGSGALVNSVCNHVLFEHYRSHHRMDSLDEETEQSFVDDRISVSGLLAVDETERAVRRILGELPERDRRLLQSVLLEERDKDEVCAELGLSREYLRVLVHRAKQSFKSWYLKR